MSGNTIQKTFPARVEELRNFCAFAHAGAESAGFTEDDRNRLDLVLEELFMNVARHAYTPASGDVELAYRVTQPGQLWIQISDGGKPFDPLRRDPPDFAASLMDRELGGMGVFLIKTMIDSAEYRHIGGQNRLSFLISKGSNTPATSEA